MMTVLDLAGYFASTMVLLTFLTKDMRLLRILAIFSNIGFVTYGLLAWLPPVFCLHLLLLPVNALRLREILTMENRQAPVTWPRIFANRLKVKVTTRDWSVYRDPAVLLIDELKQIYIDGELDLVDTPQYFPKIRRKDYTVALNLQTSGPDPDPTVQLFYGCGSNLNWDNYCLCQRPDDHGQQHLQWLANGGCLTRQVDGSACAAHASLAHFDAVIEWRSPMSGGGQHAKNST